MTGTPSPYVVWFEVACQFCGDVLASLTVKETIRVVSRCTRCGGLPVFNGETHRRLVPLDVTSDGYIGPRRGRPPKVLVAQRLAQGIGPAPRRTAP